MTRTRSLHEDLMALFASVPGAQEREHLLSTLQRARRFDLTDRFVAATSSTLSGAAATVERNLDFLHLPGNACWFEWSEEARIPVGDIQPAAGHAPERVGVLLMQPDEAESMIIGTVGWRMPDGQTDHAAAFFSLHPSQLSSLAQQARYSLSDVDRECWARILSLVYAHVPPGFVAEMEVLEDIRDTNESIEELKGKAERDATAECLFCLATLVMLQAANTRVEEVDDRYLVDIAPAAPRRSDLLLKGPLAGFRRTGLVRRQRKGETGLTWYQP